MVGLVNREVFAAYGKEGFCIDHKQTIGANNVGNIRVKMLRV